MTRRADWFCLKPPAPHPCLAPRQTSSRPNNPQVAPQQRNPDKTTLLFVNTVLPARAFERHSQANHRDSDTLITLFSSETGRSLEWSRQSPATPTLRLALQKELVETVAKTILDELGIGYAKSDDLPILVKATRKALQLVPEGVSESARASDTIRRLLSNLGTVVDSLAALRNAYGTGHGRSASTGGLQPRHARLAVGSAATLATFLFETHEAREARSEGPEADQ